MRMKTSLLLALAALILLASPGSADEKAHRKAAEDLLTLMEVDKQMQSAIDQSLDIQIKTNPQLMPFRPVLKEFFTKHMTWDAVKDDMIKIYVDAFEEGEIQELIQFYKTPLGKKLIAKTPELTGKGMEIGAKRVQDNQAELVQMIQEAAKKQQQ